MLFRSERNKSKQELCEKASRIIAEIDDKQVKLEGLLKKLQCKNDRLKDHTDPSEDGQTSTNENENLSDLIRKEKSRIHERMRSCGNCVNMLKIKINELNENEEHKDHIEEYNDWYCQVFDEPEVNNHRRIISDVKSEVPYLVKKKIPCSGNQLEKNRKQLRISYIQETEEKLKSEKLKVPDRSCCVIL